MLAFQGLFFKFGKKSLLPIFFLNILDTVFLATEDCLRLSGTGLGAAGTSCILSLC